jgi:hypothetical protein
MIDLFATASANAGAIRSRFETSLTSLPAEEAVSVEEFARWVSAEGLIAINVRLWILVELLNGRAYQNVYEWAAEQAALSGRFVDDILRERLGGFYERRTAFDRQVADSEKLRYGALNAGGAGLATFFGPYCMVLKRCFRDSLSDAAYLPGDSLELCFDPEGAFDKAATERLLTPHTHRHFMVATERAPEVARTDAAEWGDLVLSGRRYFEVIFAADFSLDAVDGVRVFKTEHNRMWTLAFDNFGRKLGDAERAFVQDFIQLRRAILEGRIQVEVLG